MHKSIKTPIFDPKTVDRLLVSKGRNHPLVFRQDERPLTPPTNIPNIVKIESPTLQGQLPFVFLKDGSSDQVQNV